ncbi:MAG: S8 family serine peptidase [Candidatus Bathyarchaeia archaeon]
MAFNKSLSHTFATLLITALLCTYLLNVSPVYAAPWDLTPRDQTLWMACDPPANTTETESNSTLSWYDKWMKYFNETSNWNEFAWVENNKTRLIVGVNYENSTLNELEEIASNHQAEVVRAIPLCGDQPPTAFVVELPLEKVLSFVEDIRNEKFVRYVEPNLKYKACSVPNDPEWNNQWALNLTGIDWAWNITTGNKSIIVAVLDTGIDYTHPDLDSNIWRNTGEIPNNYKDDDQNGFVDDYLGVDFTGERFQCAFPYKSGTYDNDPLDEYGHGTLCAGVIAATINNGIGIAGVANVNLMVIKIARLFQDGNAYTFADWMSDGIYYANNMGADIINVSFGGDLLPLDNYIIHEEVKVAYLNGKLIIAGAGNGNTNGRRYPAAYEEVIAVVATNKTDQRWVDENNPSHGSNYGDWVELAAPGACLLTTMPTYHVTMNDHPYNLNQTYDSFYGTSLACSFITGVAALVWSAYPYLSRDQVRLHLIRTADDLGEAGFDRYYGWGRINARKALETQPTPTPTPPTSFNPLLADYGQGFDTYIMYEPLFGFDRASNSLIKWLGRNIQWVNSTCIEITLRSGAKWVKISNQDSATIIEQYRQITAEDVKYSFMLHHQHENLDNFLDALEGGWDGGFLTIDATTIHIYLKPEYAYSQTIWQTLTNGYLIVPA